MYENFDLHGSSFFCPGYHHYRSYNLSGEEERKADGTEFWGTSAVVRLILITVGLKLAPQVAPQVALQLAPQPAPRRAPRGRRGAEGAPGAGGQQSPWGARLPPELLARVFQEVVGREGALPFLCRAARVCRLWRAAASAPHLWGRVSLGGRGGAPPLAAAAAGDPALAPHPQALDAEGDRALGGGRATWEPHSRRCPRAAPSSTVSTSTTARCPPPRFWGSWGSPAPGCSGCGCAADPPPRPILAALAVSTPKTGTPPEPLKFPLNPKTSPAPTPFSWLSQSAPQKRGPPKPSPEPLKSLAGAGATPDGAGLERLLRRSPHLRSLDLRRCPRIPLSAVLALPCTASWLGLVGSSMGWLIPPRVGWFSPELGWSVPFPVLSGGAVVAPGLEQLLLGLPSGWAVTVAGVEEALVGLTWRWRRSLRALDLSGRRFHPRHLRRALAAFGPRSPLRHLDLAATEVSAGALSRLSRCPHLVSLNLGGCRRLPRGTKRHHRGRRQVRRCLRRLRELQGEDLDGEDLEEEELEREDLEVEGVGLENVEMENLGLENLNGENFGMEDLEVEDFMEDLDKEDLDEESLEMEDVDSETSGTESVEQEGL
ncbi:F-box/LRR-repeat protein 6 [Phaenicophaeus curvirostris]|uniref:F-box/LRR-repeat protein 6 n=1 Tax=Phaenicophaeus curvirostris TaxID=33595 RepID=UPI0037F09FB6